MSSPAVARAERSMRLVWHPAPRKPRRAYFERDGKGTGEFLALSALKWTCMIVANSWSFLRLAAVVQCLPGAPQRGLEQQFMLPPACEVLRDSG
mmetsp:Transcript_60205/g.140718  ORF Transcript_60205/g.140718 Transcript_60205/m.140718 type:complete len:94 (-) Transcript_60205:74-355(-)